MIYHAGITAKIVRAYAQINPKAKLDALLSYGIKNMHTASLLFQDRHLVGNVACDSGTWTLNQNPAKYRDTITLKGYSGYLRNLASKFEFYFNFDDDFSAGGFENNLWNQLRLEEQGLRPVPVIHDCYSKEEVGYYIDHGYEMVAIGSGELKMQGVTELNRITEKFHAKGIKVHFLGCTEYLKLANTPVYSCDSSSWGQKGTKGYILYWNPEKPGEDKTDAIDFVANQHGRVFYKDYPFLWDLEEHIESRLGLPIEALAGRENIFNRILATIDYFVQLEDLIAQRHKQLGYTF